MFSYDIFILLSSVCTAFIDLPLCLFLSYIYLSFLNSVFVVCCSCYEGHDSVIVFHPSGWEHSDRSRGRATATEKKSSTETKSKEPRKQQPKTSAAKGVSKEGRSLPRAVFRALLVRRASAGRRFSSPEEHRVNR